MPSFDIVCELDQVNLRHVVENTQREISNRFDFKGISATAELKEKTLTLTTESDFQVQQMEQVASPELFVGRLGRSDHVVVIAIEDFFRSNAEHRPVPTPLRDPSHPVEQLRLVLVRF